MLLGSMLMFVTGGPRRLVFGVLGGGALVGTLFLLGAARPSLLLACIGAFGAYFAFPVMGGSSETIWQRKTPPEMQGRVFSFRWLVGRSMMPLASVSTGPLADLVFEPMLRPGGLLASSIGTIVGVGKGRGSGLMLALFGLALVVYALVSVLNPRLRNVEKELPDCSPAP
jgi:hypothetical protein